MPTYFGVLPLFILEVLYGSLVFGYSRHNHIPPVETPHCVDRTSCPQPLVLDNVLGSSSEEGASKYLDAPRSQHASNMFPLTAGRLI